MSSPKVTTVVLALRKIGVSRKIEPKQNPIAL